MPKVVPASWNKSAAVRAFSTTLNQAGWFLLQQKAHCTESTADALILLLFFLNSGTQFSGWVKKLSTKK